MSLLFAPWFLDDAKLNPEIKTESCESNYNPPSPLLDPPWITQLKLDQVKILDKPTAEMSLCGEFDPQIRQFTNVNRKFT